MKIFIVILIISILTIINIPAQQTNYSNVAIGNVNESSQSDYIDRYINLAGFQCQSNINVTNIFAKVRNISGKYKMAIYSGDSSQPSRLIQSTETIINPPTGWKSFSLISSTSLTNGQWYWFAIWSDTIGAGVYYQSTGGKTIWENSPRTFGNFPITLNLIPTVSSFNYNIYVEASTTNVINTNPPVTKTVTLAWDPSPDPIQRYVIHYGKSSRSYSGNTNAGTKLTQTVQNLIEGETYYFAATAIGTNSLESDFSNEVVYTVPKTNAISLPSAVENVKIDWVGEHF
jgi:hypothetical protein